MEIFVEPLRGDKIGLTVDPLKKQVAGVRFRCQATLLVEDAMSIEMEDVHGRL